VNKAPNFRRHLWIREIERLARRQFSAATDPRFTRGGVTERGDRALNLLGRQLWT
jgi:hypothetical protein